MVIQCRVAVMKFMKDILYIVYFWKSFEINCLNRLIITFLIPYYSMLKCYKNITVYRFLLPLNTTSY